MHELIARLAGLWVGRYAKPDPDALAAVAGLEPATIVTGGSEGIGLALAHEFAARGHTVLLVARRTEPLATAAALLRQQTTARIETLALDITLADAGRQLEAGLAALKLYGDILVNNAGIGLSGPFTEHAEAEVAGLIDCNIRAAALLMHLLLPAMLRRGRGGVLNVASLGGFVPGPFQAVYYASKSFLIGLTEAARWESRGLGVRIAVLAPGPVETLFHQRMGSETAFYRLLVPATTAEHVGRVGYRGYVCGKGIIVPGIAARVLAMALFLLPWAATVPVVGWLLQPRGGSRNA